MTASVTTTAPIDHNTLAPTIPGRIMTLYAGDGTTTVTALDDDVTQAELEDAVAAHVPPAAPPTTEEVLALVDELTLAFLDVMGGGL